MAIRNLIEEQARKQQEAAEAAAKLKAQSDANLGITPNTDQKPGFEQSQSFTGAKTGATESTGTGTGTEGNQSKNKLDTLMGYGTAQVDGSTAMRWNNFFNHTSLLAFIVKNDQKAVFSRFSVPKRDESGEYVIEEENLDAVKKNPNMSATEKARLAERTYDYAFKVAAPSGIMGALVVTAKECIDSLVATGEGLAKALPADAPVTKMLKGLVGNNLPEFVSAACGGRIKENPAVVPMNAVDKNNSVFELKMVKKSKTAIEKLGAGATALDLVNIKIVHADKRSVVTPGNYIANNLYEKRLIATMTPEEAKEFTHHYFKSIIKNAGDNPAAIFGYLQPNVGNIQYNQVDNTISTDFINPAKLEVAKQKDWFLKVDKSPAILPNPFLNVKEEKVTEKDGIKNVTYVLKKDVFNVDKTTKDAQGNLVVERVTTNKLSNPIYETIVKAAAAEGVQLTDQVVVDFIENYKKATKKSRTSSKDLTPSSFAASQVAMAQIQGKYANASGASQSVYNMFTL